MIYRKDYPKKPHNHKAIFIATAISAVLLLIGMVIKQRMKLVN